MLITLYDNNPLYMRLWYLHKLRICAIYTDQDSLLLPDPIIFTDYRSLRTQKTNITDDLPLYLMESHNRNVINIHNDMFFSDIL